MTIPVAFYRQQGQVTLTHVCSPLTIAAKTGLSHCAATVTNLASVSANASLNVTNLDRGRGLDFTSISAPAKAIKRNDGAKWSGSLTPALPPQVASIASVGTGGATCRCRFRRRPHRRRGRRHDHQLQRAGVPVRR